MGLEDGIVLYYFYVSTSKKSNVSNTVYFRGICTTMQVYRGKYGIVEYVCAGTVTGAMYKFNMGPRGWIVGGALGIY